MFAALKRGRRGGVLDRKTAAGASDLRRLCESADVLIESFRPGVLERLLPPPWPERLVVCPISGFGQSPSAFRDRAGHDIGYLPLAGGPSPHPAPPAPPLAPPLRRARPAPAGSSAPPLAPVAP